MSSQLVCRACANSGRNSLSPDGYCTCQVGFQLRHLQASKSLEIDLKKRFDFDLKK